MLLLLRNCLGVSFDEVCLALLLLAHGVGGREGEAGCADMWAEAAAGETLLELGI